MKRKTEPVKPVVIPEPEPVKAADAKPAKSAKKPVVPAKKVTTKAKKTKK
ncbi:MAG: hypothetical protein HQL30_12770 [Candidatus Omnitrophica bacterium]|nr:hypothetical protein [Candidatus Omnitrophota bacterium]